MSSFFNTTKPWRLEANLSTKETVLTSYHSGPLISYIALCPNMECRKLKATDAKWAKIDEVSIRDDKTWAQEDLGELPVQLLYLVIILTNYRYSQQTAIPPPSPSPKASPRAPTSSGTRSSPCRTPPRKEEPTSTPPARRSRSSTAGTGP